CRIVYFSPLTISFLGLILIWAAHKNFQNRQALQITSTGRTGFFYLLFFVALSGVFFILFSKSIKNFPIDAAFSDVVPTLKYYCTRLLHGEYVYAPINYSTWTVIPNYLTFQWLPFVVAEFFHFDYRFIALIAYYLVLLVWVFYLVKNSKETPAVLVLKLLLPVIFLYSFYDRVPSVYGFSVELLIASYYLFLAFGLIRKHTLVLILALGLCLFSRFSLLFWLPVLAMFLYLHYSFKYFLRLFFGVFLVGFFSYVLPFMTQDPWVFFKGMQYYGDAAIGEWVLKAYQNTGEYPDHLGKGIGYAVYFYDFYPGSLEEKLLACRMTHLILSLLIGLALCIVFYWKKGVWKSPFYLLLALKLYFIIFYSFIHVPYIYLQLVPLSISLAIVLNSQLFKGVELNKY
ncbi:MAG: hypothetical protein KDC82_07775, partial [Bacteroidetes bacterium]|nr:hypothetical protein [Bacteroidota bacterium]